MPSSGRWPTRGKNQCAVPTRAVNIGINASAWRNGGRKDATSFIQNSAGVGRQAMISLAKSQALRACEIATPIIEIVRPRASNQLSDS